MKRGLRITFANHTACFLLLRVKEIIERRIGIPAQPLVFRGEASLTLKEESKRKTLP